MAFRMKRHNDTGTASWRKGVSPLIAAVLLIAFTMAVAAILTAWVTTFTQEQTSAVSNNSDQLIQCQYAQISIYAANWDGSGNVDVTVNNQGTVDLNNVTVYAFRNAAVQGQSSILDLASGSLDDTTISGLGSKPERLRAASDQCPNAKTEESDISG